MTKRTSENKIKYTKFRNLLNNLLHTSKKLHITAEIEANKFNIKQTWKTLNNLLGRNKQTKLPDFFKDEDGNKITDSTNIANNFNSFFTNIGTKRAEKISDPNDDYQSPLNSFNQENSIFLNPTNPEEIREISNKLKSSKAKKKKKNLCLKAAARICFSVRIWFCKIQTFIFFSWNYFFLFIFTTKNEESLLFWKNLSTWELKIRVKFCLISENTEVETFQSFLVSDVCGAEAKANWSKKKIK